MMRRPVRAHAIRLATFECVCESSAEEHAMRRLRPAALAERTEDRGRPNPNRFAGAGEMHADSGSLREPAWSSPAMYELPPSSPMRVSGM
jgi:hypothetical protein